MLLTVAVLTALLVLVNKTGAINNATSQGRRFKSTITSTIKTNNERIEYTISSMNMS